MWTGYTFGEPAHGSIKSFLEQFNEAMAPPLSILDVYAMNTVRAVLADSVAAARLRQFAKPRGRASDIDFLLQVGHYDDAVATVASIAATISIRFAGIGASEPVKLSLPVGKNLNNDLRETSTALIPALRSTFDDARISVEQNLAQDIYPEFLRTQLSLNLQAIGPGYSPNQVCPEFGEAFFMTDPNGTDDPIVFVSTGLASLTGYSMRDIIFENCRLFQGPGTRVSCVDRLRNALSQDEELTELVLNYKKDGKPYWNLVFLARLAEVDGTVRYNLGGQIDVTELVEREEDLTHLLSHVSPLSARPATKPRERDRRASWRGDSREMGEQKQPRYPPSSSRNKFMKTFRRRFSQADENATDYSTDISISEPPTPDVEPRGSTITSPLSLSTTNHFATVSPYSRFMVFEYMKTTKHGAFHDKKSSRVRMPVQFCSSAALESMGPGCRNLANVLGLEVFEMLAEKANSPSVTKTFKSTVRASLAEGRTAKLNISFNHTTRSRPRGISLSRKRSGLNLSGAETPSNQAHSLRRSLSLDRLVPICGSSSGSAEDFVSYWTPLKDDLGAVRWVVMILVPEIV